MKDFIDETSEQAGTPINRANLMAIQGFISSSVEITSDGNIVETNSKGETLTTTFNDDGSVTERFVGQKTITKTTRIDGETIVSEVIT